MYHFLTYVFWQFQSSGLLVYHLQDIFVTCIYVIVSFFTKYKCHVGTSHTKIQVPRIEYMMTSHTKIQVPCRDYITLKWWVVMHINEPYSSFVTTRKYWNLSRWPKDEREHGLHNRAPERKLSCTISLYSTIPPYLKILNIGAKLCWWLIEGTQ